MSGWILRLLSIPPSNLIGSIYHFSVPVVIFYPPMDSLFIIKIIYLFSPFFFTWLLISLWAHRFLFLYFKLYSNTVSFTFLSSFPSATHKKLLISLATVSFWFHSWHFIRFLGMWPSCFIKFSVRGLVRRINGLCACHARSVKNRFCVPQNSCKFWVAVVSCL